MIFLLRRSPGPARMRLGPALDAAAFHDLFAELHAQLVVGNPGDRAKAERSFTIQAQPEQGRQVLWILKVHQCPVLRYVAHGAAQVFGLERVKNRGLHKRRAPRGTAVFNQLLVMLHLLIQPQNSLRGQAYSRSLKLCLLISLKLSGFLCRFRRVNPLSSPAERYQIHTSLLLSLQLSMC